VVGAPRLLGDQRANSEAVPGDAHRARERRGDERAVNYDSIMVHGERARTGAYEGGGEGKKLRRGKRGGAVSPVRSFKHWRGGSGFSAEQGWLEEKELSEERENEIH